MGLITQYFTGKHSTAGSRISGYVTRPGTVEKDSSFTEEDIKYLHPFIDSTGGVACLVNIVRIPDYSIIFRDFQLLPRALLQLTLYIYIVYG